MDALEAMRHEHRRCADYLARRDVGPAERDAQLRMVARKREAWAAAGGDPTESPLADAEALLAPAVTAEDAATAETVAPAKEESSTGRKRRGRK